MPSTPLVSCLMLPGNRQLFVKQAIWYFLRQNYPAKELIIVDDGVESAVDLIPSDERIRYVRLPKVETSGAKYAMALQLSRGELLAHWCDDDWIGAQRLSVQVDQLLARSAQVCGVADALYYCLEQGQAWRYRSHAVAPPRLIRDTLLYDRSVDIAFSAASILQQSFLHHIPPESILVLSNTSFYIVVAHAGKNIHINQFDPHWQQRPLEEVTQQIGYDRDFYITLRHGSQTHTAARRDHARVTVAAPYLVYDGYGSVAEYIALSMARAGAEVDVVPLRIDPAGLSTEFHDLLAQSRPDPRSPTLIFAWPEENFARFSTSRDLFINTMWETSRIPTRWVARLSLARAIIVPSHFVARAFRNSGVGAPIEVVVQGVDPALYHYETRAERSSLVTLMVATFVPRKNILEGIAAWKKAFARDPHARLIIKTRFQLRRYEPDDSRIQFVDSNETTRGIAHWYQQADILLALGNEGFGLPLVEAMATGMAVVALNSEGQADVCEAAQDCLLTVPPARWQPFDEPPFGACGVRAIPDIDAVVECLHWIDQHRPEARAMGRRAAAWVQEHRNIWAMGPALLEVMERYSTSVRSLRRLPTLWQAPQSSGTCALQFAPWQAVVQVVSQMPDLHRVRVLHVQYEDGLFDELELLRSIHQARYSGVPVVVMVHHVGTQARPWECAVDALVVHTADAADTLRARWPHQRIEVIPCPGEGAPGVAGQHLALWRSLAPRG